MNKAQRLILFNLSVLIVLLVLYMGKTKKDLGRRVQNIKRRIEELEQQVRMDPLKKKPFIHEELAQLKKKLEEK